MNNEENLDFIDSLPTALTHIKSLMTIIRGKNEKLSSKDVEIERLKEANKRKKDEIEGLDNNNAALSKEIAKQDEEIQQLKEEAKTNSDYWNKRAAEYINRIDELLVSKGVTREQIEKAIWGFFNNDETKMNFFDSGLDFAIQEYIKTV